MTTKGHCESSLGSFDECSTAHKRLSTLRPSHLTWAVSLPVVSYRLQPPSPFIIITQPESWYSFTIPCRVEEGWVDLGTAGRVHTACAQGCKSQWLCNKHNCPQRDSIPGPRALQSDMLSLDHCDLHNVGQSLTQMYATDVRQHHCLMPLPIRGGGIIRQSWNADLCLLIQNVLRLKFQ